MLLMTFTINVCISTLYYLPSEAQDYFELEDKNGFSHQEKMTILNKHNELRAKAASQNMRRMHWDETLGTMAQVHANSCDWKHFTEQHHITDVGPFKFIGENFYSTTDALNIVNGIEYWYNETKYYNYDENMCNNICDHYTQVVWAASYALGCGVKLCSKFQRSPFGYGYYLVCLYGPGKHAQLLRPYKRGDACTDCPPVTKFCVQGLCGAF
ncbi:Glioma pathoproteinsis- protein 1 [Bulinus truncatus]|nr:Glioma pathoproteinsis- protein 1 [Bulinus truncatus]